MKIYEVLAQALSVEGTDVAFTVMDEMNMLLPVEMKEKFDIHIVTARHEQGAILMADGYSRATGKLGVAIVGAGPAFAQTGTGLMTLSLHRSSVLVITADTPRNDHHNAKRFNNRSFTEITARTFFDLSGGDTTLDDIQSAFRHIRAGYGPAVLNVPGDLFHQEVSDRWTYRSTARCTSSLQRGKPDPRLVQEAALVLKGSRKPVLIAGWGAYASGAREAMERLAYRTGALLANTVQAHSFFDGNPYSLGLAGGLSTDSALECLKESDCVVAVGASLNAYTTRQGQLFPRARVIQIDEDPQRMGLVVPIEIGVVGDGRETVIAIDRWLEQDGVKGRTGFRVKGMDQRLAVSRAWLQGPYPEKSGFMDPRQLVAEMNRLLPRDRTIVVEGGHFCLFASTGLHVPNPSDFIWGNDFAAVGVGLPIATGVAVGRPDKHCVLVVGDGGFMMSLPELETAARHRVAFTVVIMNDGAYGAEAHLLEAYGKPTFLSRFKNPEFEDVAGSLGCRGVTVRSLQELEDALSMVGQQDVPLVVDVKINYDVVHWAFGERKH